MEDQKDSEAITPVITRGFRWLNGIRKMDENMFWFLQWSMILFFAVSTAFIVSVSIDRSNARLAELINQGHDPIAVKCAFSPTGANVTVCSLYVTNEKKNSK